MNPMITNVEKKTFVEWFLKNFDLQKRECAWLLTYLMSDAKLLQNVRFVDEIGDIKRSILMSTKCVNEVAFQFRKRKMISTDVERAFHDIRLNPNEDILIKLLFDDAERCSEYAAVREVGSMDRGRLSTNNLYSLLAEMVLDEAIERFERDRLYKRIDQALADQDKQTFDLLSRQWRQLSEEEI